MPRILREKGKSKPFRSEMHNGEVPKIKKFSILFNS